MALEAAMLGANTTASVYISPGSASHTRAAAAARAAATFRYKQAAAVYPSPRTPIRHVPNKNNYMYIDNSTSLTVAYEVLRTHCW